MPMYVVLQSVGQNYNVLCGFSQMRCLGTLDPTLRENGTYELQLIVNTLDGSFFEIPGPQIVLDGNMKIGHFALAFEDLSVPMPGLNITFTRSYDCRL
jgi:hypothetical protein